MARLKRLFLKGANMKSNKTFKILFILLLIFISYLFISEVQANSIYSINMDIYIDPSGNAHITEIWDCNATQGTEVYHPYYNLGNSKIFNLSVKDGNQTYTTLSSWNTSASFENKKYTCGLNAIYDGVEICWGISSYGNHKYEVSYTISNFVSELNDYQMAYWTLIPHDLSNTVGNVYIKIYSDFAYSSDLDVWGYGKYGAPCYVYDGYIEFTTDNSTLYSNEYMTILIKFPLGSFNTQNRLYDDFDYYLNMAEEGTIHYNYSNNSSLGESLIGFVVTIGFIAFFVFIIILGAKAGSLSSPSKLDFGESGKKIPSDVGYFRDIPCNKNIFHAYFISYNYSIMRNKTNLLGAVLLKWLKEGKISVSKRTVGKIMKKEETCVILNDPSTSTNGLENTLYSYLKTASKDDILEPNEFKKWCSSNYTKILTWFDDILNSEKLSLVTEGKIIESEIGNKYKRKRYTATDSLFEDAKQLQGLKNFLKDLTLISKREAIEVVLFEEYLMFATIFGIARQVQKDFEKIYPNILEDYNSNYNYSDIAFIYAFSHTATSAASAAKSRAESYSGRGRRLLFRWPVAVAHLAAVAGGRRFPLRNCPRIKIRTPRMVCVIFKILGEPTSVGRI